MLDRFFLAVIFAFALILLAVNSFSQAIDPFYTLRGIAVDYATGSSISLGNVTLVVKETGDRNASIIKDGIWIVNVSTTANYNQNKLTLGILVNSSDGKHGYDVLTLGTEGFLAQTATCTYRPWTFSGYLIDLSTGLTQNSGTISVLINDAPFSNVTSNSTSISNGYFSLFIYPCLISGKIYDFRFTTISGSSVTSIRFLRTVAK